MSSKRLDQVSIREIMAEIVRRRRARARLLRAKKRLLKQLRALEARLGSNGSSGSRARTGRRGKRGRKRARNKMTLPQAMAKVMSKRKPLSVPQIAAAAARAGYKSTSKTFNTIIYQTLARDRKLFKKAKRGRYVLKAA